MGKKNVSWKKEQQGEKENNPADKKKAKKLKYKEQSLKTKKYSCRY